MRVLALKVSKREEMVMTALRNKKRLKTKDAAEMLGVSECTVRRLFEEMEKRGEVERVYGGIRLPVRKQNEYHFENQQLCQSEQKRRIGECASGMVESGEIIFLDNGTTIQQMALYLVERIKRNELSGIQVFTNSLRNLTILADYCDVNLIGGLFRGKRKDFCGYLAEMMLETVSFEKCFLSSDAISLLPGDGIMAMDIFTAKLNQIVARRAGKFFLLADSTKFSRRSFIKYAEISAVSKIITDRSLPENMIQALEDNGPEVIRV